MSFPMLVDRPVDVGTAVATSVRAVAHTPVNMLKWGLIVAVLLLLGSIPVFIGLAVVLPWLGYATWHLYTRVVEIAGEPHRPAASKDADRSEPPRFRHDCGSTSRSRLSPCHKQKK